jgi:hypothetical protein
MAAQDIEDPGVLNAKIHKVQPRPFVGFYATGYTGILTWRAWVSSNYPPSQTQLLSLEPDDYTHYQVLQAQGTARSLAAADEFLHAHASAQSRRFAAVTARADATADPEGPPPCTRKRRRSYRVRSSSSRSCTPIGSTRFALASKASTYGPGTSRSPSRGSA